MSLLATNDQNQSTPSAERNIFLPHGRIGRVSYGVRWGAFFTAYVIMGSIQNATTGSDPNALANCVSLVLFAFLTITSIKRLHDIGYGAAAVFFLGPLFPLLLLLPGERASNAYGNPAPKPFSQR